LRSGGTHVTRAPNERTSASGGRTNEGLASSQLLLCQRGSSVDGSLYTQTRCAGKVCRLHFCHMGHTLTVRLDKTLADWLEEESRKTGESQGKIVRDQLERAKASSRQSFMRLAGSTRGPKDLSRRKGFSRG
jgi:hypothetical protein